MQFVIELILNLENCLNFGNSYNLIYKSDENVFYMKVAQNNETNPNMRFVYLSDASNYLNMELSLSGHLSDTDPEPGKHSRLTSPFTGIV